MSATEAPVPPAAVAPARLTVIVPATDRPPTLARCLAAIAAAQEGPDEVIVVDSPAGAGPAEARNAGAARATGDLLAFVDSDVEVHSDAFVRLRRRFAREPALAAVCGSYDDEPAAPGAVSVFRNLLHHHVHQAAAGPLPSFWAGLGAVRREAFSDVGGFDDRRYPDPSIEDIELGMRLSAAGARCHLDGAVQGTHLKRWTLRSMVATDFQRRGVPWVGLILRSAGRGGASLNLGWRHRTSALAVLAIPSSLVARRPRLALLSLGALVTLNRDFYALLMRRGGARLALAGVALHAVHHLVAIGSVPAGLAVHGWERLAARAAGRTPDR